MNAKVSYTKLFLKAAEYEVSDDNIKNYLHTWWWNNRQQGGGLRLTDDAFNFINNYAKIKTYKVDFPKEFSVTAQVLIWLDRFIDSPYYITGKSITVLKERSAFELYLFSGDVRKYGHNKALSQRLSQECPPE
jgi:hypothetical protein